MVALDLQKGPDLGAALEVVGDHDGVAARVGRHTLDVLASWIMLQLGLVTPPPPMGTSDSPSGLAALAIFYRQDIDARPSSIHGSEMSPEHQGSDPPPSERVIGKYKGIQWQSSC
jgi:hypothetical protein